MNFKEQIDTTRLPKHIAIIMDGNGRWAKERGKMRVFGHENGVRAVRDTAEAAAEIGVEYVTLYAFSTENWNRPQMEVDALMNLLVKTINKETETLNKNDIRLQAIGDLKSLKKDTYKELMLAIENTSKNKRMTLTLALSYSSRWEIVDAVKQIAEKVKSGELTSQEISDETINQHLTTNFMPDPELLIRTSGEQRISNYMLWQIAYSELYFCPKYWPDFNKEDFYKAIVDYQMRERRFGKTSEQITK
ncbi:MAG: isoprenyl transferase [Bacteroidales bacterium]|nr:isoprenyl transferase [Bacteroidales bacterium]